MTPIYLNTMELSITTWKVRKDPSKKGPHPAQFIATYSVSRTWEERTVHKGRKEDPEWRKNKGYMSLRQRTFMTGSLQETASRTPEPEAKTDRERAACASSIAVKKTTRSLWFLLPTLPQPLLESRICLCSDRFLQSQNDSSHYLNNERVKANPKDRETLRIVKNRRMTGGGRNLFVKSHHSQGRKQKEIT